MAFACTGGTRVSPYATSACKPAIYVAAAGLICAASLAAAHGPAHRASRIDPVRGTTVGVNRHFRGSNRTSTSVFTLTGFPRSMRG